MDDMDMEPTVDGDPNLDNMDGMSGDEFGASAAAAGGDEQADRPRRESVERKRSVTSEASRRLASTLSKKK